MKVSCLLTSYNRPRWLRHALLSVADQTYRDYQLIVVDESTVFDVKKVVAEFEFPRVDILKVSVAPHERQCRNAVGANLNRAMELVQGELVCYLCDDDYYYPRWFSQAVAFFEEHQDRNVGFGVLTYSTEQEMIFPRGPRARRRFFNRPLSSPLRMLDHNQVIHRKFSPPYRWPEDLEKIKEPDGYYFNEIGKDHLFHPIPALAVVKREHEKALRRNVEALTNGTLDAVRE